MTSPSSSRPGLGACRRSALGAPRRGTTYAAVVGYPGGGRLRITPARTGAATRDPAIRVDGEPVNNELVPLRAPTVKPGSSGSPIVDTHGRVRSMVFAGGKTAIRQWGVPTGPMRRALRRAGPPVSHGRCN